VFQTACQAFSAKSSNPDTTATTTVQRLLSWLSDNGEFPSLPFTTSVIVNKYSRIS
jgi:hypothetical protein